MLWIRDVNPGSRILIFIHPGSQIPDLGSWIQKQQQKRGVKKISCHTFHLTKLKIILFLKRWRKKCGPIFKELLNFLVLPKRLSLSSQKYGFGIRDPEKTFSGFRIQGSKKHRIPDLRHCCQHRRTLGQEHPPASVKTHGQKNKYQKHSDRVMSAEIQLQAFKPQQL